MKDISLEKAKNAKRESKYIEFKEKFDIREAQDWCEIIKDIIAVANSGGGWILIGVKRDGSLSGWDDTPVVIFGVKAKLYTLRTALAEFGGKGER
jgi:predicted HTH transcriptional regulator